jgi:DNA-binding IclR family transcriptional regulator
MTAGIQAMLQSPRQKATGKRPDGPRAPMVAPFARALLLLGAFTPQERWLGNRDLTARTGIPASTISRLAQALAVLGYLHYDTENRKYRLAAPVLALGYGAIANSGLQRSAREHMQAYADMHRVHVNLSTRDRLELIVMESCSGAQSPLSLNLHVGARVGIGSSPMGWSLLAGLPELERYYLMENVERRMPREWPRLRRRLGEAISQIFELGYCSSIGEWDPDLGIIATPVLVEGHAPLVIACVGGASQFTRARVQRELGPRLLATVAAIQQTGAGA